MSTDNIDVMIKYTMCSICICTFTKGYVAHLHVTSKNDKHKIHKIYARQYRNNTNNKSTANRKLYSESATNRQQSDSLQQIHNISTCRDVIQQIATYNKSATNRTSEVRPQ